MQKRDARSQVLITPSFDEMVVVRSWLGLPKSNHLYQMHHITPTLNKISCQHVASLTLGGTAAYKMHHTNHPIINSFISKPVSIWQPYSYTRNSDVHGQGTGKICKPRSSSECYINCTFEKNIGAKIGPGSHVEPNVKSPNRCVVKRPVVVIDHFVNSLSFKVSTCWGPQSLDVSQGCTSSTTVACLLYGTNMGAARAQEQTWTCRLHSNAASSGLFCGTKRIVGVFCQVARFGFVELLFWTWRFACQAQAQGFFSCNTISRPSKSLFPLVVGFCLWSLRFRSHAWDS